MYRSPFTKITLPQEHSLKQSNQTRIPPELQQSSYQTQTKKIQKKTRPQITCILTTAKKRSKSTIRSNHVPRSNSQYFMKFEELTTSGRISFLVPNVNAMRLIVTSNRESRIKNRRKRLLMINNNHTKLLFYLQRLHQHILSKFNHNLRGSVFLDGACGQELGIHCIYTIMLVASMSTNLCKYVKNQKFVYFLFHYFYFKNRHKPLFRLYKFKVYNKKS